MIRVHNHTSMPHLAFEKEGPGGAPLDVIVVRGTFDLPAQGTPVTLARVQTPIAFGDRLDGLTHPHPLRAVLASEGDLVAFKPGTDVTVSGAACAPGNQPTLQWLGRLRLGPINKTVRFCGPRTFERRRFGWKLSSATALRRVRLDDRLAYGGCFDLDEHGQDVLSFEENPAGLGWLPDRKALRGLDKAAREALRKHLKQLERIEAPQIEAPEAPLLAPTAHGRYLNFTARPRWAASRSAFQGTLDDAWLADRYPLPPTDFSPEFYQCAPPDQVCRPWLEGNEALTLEGLLPEARYTTHLPGLSIVAVAAPIRSIPFVVFPVLDTVRIDLDNRRLSLIWRAHFERSDPVRELTLGTVPTPQARGRNTPAPHATSAANSRATAA